MGCPNSKASPCWLPARVAASAVRLRSTLPPRGPTCASICLRIGINIGDVVIEAGDIFGDGVNVAARLEAAAPKGGILVSEAVHAQIRGKVAAPFSDAGELSLKNIAQPVRAWRWGGGEEEAATPAPAERKPLPGVNDLPSIAVLPFDNMSRDPDQDFLADGIVEDVITELSRFRTLLVIARNSTFAYRGVQKDVREIAKELDVRYVVEGSVRRAGDRLRLTAQLIEAATGTHIWAERWDRTMADLFDLQDELTQGIVSGVEPELGANERALARRKPTESLTAWELCQRGYAEFTSNPEEGLQASLEYCRTASRLDPQFALPDAIMARVYWYLIGSGRTRDQAGDVERGIEHARRAIRRDDRLELANAALAVHLAFADRYADAREQARKTVELNPNNHVGQYARSLVENFSANPDSDVMESAAEAALRLSPKDPLAWLFQIMIGHARLFRHWDYAREDVREAFEAACRYENADYFAPFNAAIANAAAGRMEPARSYLQATQARRPDISVAAWRAAWRYPSFPSMIAAAEQALKSLVALGLPIE